MNQATIDLAKSVPDIVTASSPVSSISSPAKEAASNMSLNAAAILEEGDEEELKSNNELSPKKDKRGSFASGNRRTSSRMSKSFAGGSVVAENSVHSGSVDGSRKNLALGSSYATNRSSAISNNDSIDSYDDSGKPVKKGQTLAEMLNDTKFAPPADPDATKNVPFKSEVVELLESIPKKVTVTVDPGFIVISSADGASEPLYRISHGSCLAMLSNRDKTLEVLHKHGKLRLKSDNVDMTMAIICEVNTATSKAAAARGMSSTFDKPKVAQSNIEWYRTTLRGLLSELEPPSLENVVTVVGALVKDDFAPDHRLSGFRKDFKLSQSSLLAASNSLTDMSGNRGYEVVPTEEERKYKVNESHEDLNDAKSPVPGVLLRHMSNSSVDMVVRYEVNPDGTFTHAIGAATLEKLVERLADEEIPDQGFISIFLHTFRHFTTVETVLGLLTQRMEAKSPADATAEQLEFVESWASVIKMKYVLILIS